MARENQFYDRPTTGRPEPGRKVSMERMIYTCTTPGCEVVGHFTDEPTFCSICLEDLTGVYDTTGELLASTATDESRPSGTPPVASEANDGN